MGVHGQRQSVRPPGRPRRPRNRGTGAPSAAGKHQSATSSADGGWAGSARTGTAGSPRWRRIRSTTVGRRWAWPRYQSLRSTARGSYIRPVGRCAGSLSATGAVYAGEPWWQCPKTDTEMEGGREYLRELVRPARAGQRVALVFVVQRGDCVAFRPADEVDPEYSCSFSELATYAPTTSGSDRSPRRWRTRRDRPCGTCRPGAGG